MSNNPTVAGNDDMGHEANTATYEEIPYVEVDSATEDSDYGSSIESEVHSIASSLDAYMEQNGRKYHTYYGLDKNPMPADDTEQSRLDVVHELFYFVSGKKFHQAPLEKGRIHRVLDLGTGTGVWAIDFANENPQAEVIGLDLSPIQPSWYTVPPNCRFEIDDFELEWTYKAPFDFIHARTLAHSVSDWPALLSEAFRCLSPGGYIELSEEQFIVKSDDNTVPADWVPSIVMNMIREALLRIGRHPPDGKEMRDLLQNAGFVDVHIRHGKVPFGSWPKDPELKHAGEMMLLSVHEKGYEAYAGYLLTNVLGMEAEEMMEWCERATRTHLEDRMSVHAYLDHYIGYARKPEIGE